MDQWQFNRFVQRVGEMLEYVPEDESELIQQIRGSLPRWHPDRDAGLRLAREINRLYSFLGQAKTNELTRLAAQVYVEIDEHMTRKEADRLWEHLVRYHETYHDEGIPV